MLNKLFFYLFLAGSLIPNLLLAQFVQQGPKLIGTGAPGNSDQGYAVSISSDGNTAVVGGCVDNNNIGSVWIYTRSGGLWTQFGTKISGTGVVADSRQGWSVAISADGKTLIEGGYTDDSSRGAAWIFIRSGNTWIQQGGKLVGTGAVGKAQQGFSVAISGDGNTALVGGIADNNGSGAVWVYTRNGNVWTQQGVKLIGIGAVGNAAQGCSVAITSDGNTAAIGGFADKSYAGAVWVFSRSGGIWTQQGTKLLGTGATITAAQGGSVSISANGNTILEAGYNDNGIGAVWVFTRSGGTWIQQGKKLTGTGWVGFPTYQGWSVALAPDGNTAIVGDYNDDTGVGALWVYTRTDTTWTQQGGRLIGTGASGKAYQGWSVAISGEGTLIEGGYTDNFQKGAVWIFVNPALVGLSAVSTEIPGISSVSKNYPDPFHSITKFQLKIATAGLVKLTVYDFLGKEVAVLLNEPKQSGSYEIEFDGTGKAAGIYFYIMETNGLLETKKMILMQ